MRDHKEAFDTEGLKIVVVGQSTPEDLSAFVKGRSLPFELYCDPTLNAYRTYGLAKGSVWDIALSPKVLLSGTKSVLKGNLQTRIVGNAAQLPGSFVIVDNKIVYAHRGQTASDISPPSEILEAWTKYRNESG